VRFNGTFEQLSLRIKTQDWSISIELKGQEIDFQRIRRFSLSSSGMEDDADVEVEVQRC
jgi:hypothetical protein